MSTDLQLRGDSRRRQLDASKAYAQENGLDLLEEFQLEDIGISAFSGANVTDGALGKFLAAIEAGSVPAGSFLLVESLDRISRQSVQKSLTIFLRILDAGINLVTLSDKRVYEPGRVDVTELITSLVIMSRAHEESRTKSQRVAAAWKNKRNSAASQPLTAICPAWLCLSSDRTRYEVIEDRAETVRSIFKDAAGGIGIFSITRRLNQHAVPTFGKSKGWQSSYVGKILNNRAAIGEFQPHRKVEGERIADGDPIKGYFPAIVDEGLFYAAQQGFSERKLSGRGRKGTFITNLFSGLAKCAYCYSSMTFENKGPGPKGGQYLVCDGAKRSLGCRGIRWRYDEFEATFLAFVRELDLESIVAGRGEDSKRKTLENRIAALQSEISSVDQLMERTYQLLEKSGDLDFVSAKLKELDAKRDRLNSELQVKKDELGQLSAQLSEFYGSKSQIHDLLARLQKQEGDEIYKLRAQISSKLKSLIETLLVAPLGDIPLLEKTIEFLSNTADAAATSAVIAHLKAQFENGLRSRRYFVIGFKSRTTRGVYPSAGDPLRFEEQILDTPEGGLSRIIPEGEYTLFGPRPRPYSVLAPDSLLESDGDDLS
jgi:DNA invertase Pin-like site-specific DNA recombinase